MQDAFLFSCIYFYRRYESFCPDTGFFFQISSFSEDIKERFLPKNLVPPESS